MTQQYPPPQPPHDGYQPPPQWAPPAAQVPPAAPPKKKRKWPWIVGVIVLLFVIVGLANGGDPAPTATTTPGCTSAAGCATVPNMVGKSRSSASSAMDAAGFTGGRDQFAEVPADALVVAQDPQPGTVIGKTDSVQLTFSAGSATGGEDSAVAAPAAASGPFTSFSDGTYEVGTGDGQVAPGKYKSPGGSGTCYWARLKNNDGASGDIIANNLGQGQMILNVKSSDGYVEIRGCEFRKA